MKKIVTSLFVINILILDIVLGFFLFNYYRNKEVNEGYANVNLIPVGESDREFCDKTCKDTIFSEIESLKMANKNSKIVLSPTPTVKQTAVTTIPKTKVKNVSYLPIPGSGSVLNTSWTDITGTDFYMSKADYPGLTGIYFEANMKLLNGNGTASLRIFDVTHGIAVNGSEISTSSQTSTFVGSGAISLWEGFNHYLVQAKSLTSDTTVFESGKLKIISEN